MKMIERDLEAMIPPYCSLVSTISHRSLYLHTTNLPAKILGFSCKNKKIILFPTTANQNICTPKLVQFTDQFNDSPMTFAVIFIGYDSSG